MFRVEGEWSDEYGTGGPGFFGTRAHCRIRNVIEWAVPWAEADLVVMLVNCAEPGGCAEPWNKLIYLPTYDDDDYPFAGIALHESGHSIAWLGEEHIPCAKWKSSYPFPTFFPNVAPANDAPTAWWKQLLLPNEKDGSGGFRAVHRAGDPWVDMVKKCGPVMTPPATADMLGTYWGAMYGDNSGAPNQCRVFCGRDADGNITGTASTDYYRPEVWCTMRSTKRDMCRACVYKIREAIKNVTGP